MKDIDAVLRAKAVSENHTVCKTCKTPGARSLSFALQGRNEALGLQLTGRALWEIVAEEIPNFTASVSAFRRHLKRCRPPSE